MRIQTKGGGYDDAELYVAAAPRVGDTIRFGDWEGPVTRVIHIPTRYRDADDIAVIAELGEGTHKVPA
jgi:hypothetical protein